MGVEHVDTIAKNVIYNDEAAFPRICDGRNDDVQEALDAIKRNYAVAAKYGVWTGPTVAPPYYTKDVAASTLHGYIRSNWTFVGGVSVITPGPNPGSDANDGLSTLTPIQNPDTAYQRFGTAARDGALIIFHYAAIDGADNGFTGPGTQIGWYRGNLVFVGGGDSNVQSFLHEGPHFVRKADFGALTAQGTIGVAPAAYSYLQFAGPFGVDQYADIASYLVAVNPDGNLRIFEIPIVHNTANQVFIPDRGETGGGFDVAGTYFQGTPGAIILNIDTTDTGDVAVQGVGCYREGLINVGPASDYTNPRHTVTRMGIVGFRSFCDGLSLDRVAGYDHPAVFTKRTMCFNCRFDSNVFLHGASGRVFGYLNSVATEPACQKYSATNPQSPQVGCDLHMGIPSAGTAGGTLYIGGPGPAGNDPGGHDSGHILFFRGFSAYGNANFAAVLATDHSSIKFLDQAACLIWNCLVGVWLTDVAQARLFGNGINMQGVAVELRTGTGGPGDAITQDTVANWTVVWGKQLCGHTPFIPANYIAAGVPAANIYPTGCPARIYE